MSWLFPTGNQINLQLGWPAPALFPAAALSAAADAVMSDPAASTAALVYGPNPGALPLRRQLARWLSGIYHPGSSDTIDPLRLCVAGGASQNLSNILLRFTDPTYTRHVWMIEPTYFLACPIFADCGFAGRLRGVPEDDEGIDLDFLRAGLAAAEAEADQEKKPSLHPGHEKIYKHVVYVVPTFSNPSGKTMSLARRHALVQLAIEYDALIVSDDVYDVLCWPAATQDSDVLPQLVPPPRLVDIDRALDPDSKWGHTVSNGSFSKILAPGVRVSWSESTPAFAAFLGNTGATWSGGNPAHMTSTFVEHLLASGFLEKHVRDALVPTYAARYRAMVAAVQAHLGPLGVRITTGRPYYTTAVGGDASSSPVALAGGFFLCVTLPPGDPPTARVAQRALAESELKVAHGRMFEVHGDPGSRARADANAYTAADATGTAAPGFARVLRLCWAFHDAATIDEGVRRLRDALVACREEQEA